MKFNCVAVGLFVLDFWHPEDRVQSGVGRQVRVESGDPFLLEDEVVRGTVRDDALALQDDLLAEHIAVRTHLHQR